MDCPRDQRRCEAHGRLEWTVSVRLIFLDGHTERFEYDPVCTCATCRARAHDRATAYRRKGVVAIFIEENRVPYDH